MSEHCPTCGHVVRPPPPQRLGTCVECGHDFYQPRRGRRRLTCSDRCAAKRHATQNRQFKGVSA